jgi:nucleotide-binding universal stress UspA family protein
MKILIAADGSPYTRAAAQYVTKQAGLLKERPEIVVMHVHAPLPISKVSKKTIDAYYREESLKALEAATAELEKAGTPYTSTWCTGEPAEEIVRYASKEKCDLVVTGTRGHGALAGLAMGSVTTKLLALSKVPVLVIPKA